MGFLPPGFNSPGINAGQGPMVTKQPAAVAGQPAPVVPPPSSYAGSSIMRPDLVPPGGILPRQFQPQPPAGPVPPPKTGVGLDGNMTAPASPFTPRWGDAVPLDATGRPMSIQFNTVGDPSTGLLKQPYNQSMQLNQQGLEALRTEALRDPNVASRWRTLAQQQATDEFNRMSAGQASKAMSGLAAQGGLSQGARERLAKDAAQTNLMGRQNVWGQMAMQDEQKRLAALQGLPGQEMAAAAYKSGIEGGNIDRALKEINMGRAMQQEQFNEAMRAWGAEKTAQAAGQAGRQPSGGFISNLLSSIF